MPKVKTKRSVMDTTCSETIHNGSRGWTWDTENFKWIWVEGVVGLNVMMITPKGVTKQFIYAKNLDHAVMWTWGFMQGFNEGSKMVAPAAEEPQTFRSSSTNLSDSNVPKPVEVSTNPNVAHDVVTGEPGENGDTQEEEVVVTPPKSRVVEED